MSLEHFSSFINMGGQGAYVWGAVIAVLLALAAELATLAVRDRDSATRARPDASKDTER